MRLHELSESIETVKSPYDHMGAIRYQLGNGVIDILPDSKFSPVTSSIVNFVVDEKERGKGIGSKLLAYVSDLYPDLGGQVSSLASVVVMYKAGYRTPGMENSTLEDHVEKFKAEHDLFFARPR